MAHNYDLAIIGSGFGGSLLAMIARRLGMSVWLIEREKHPRFAIGESSTPMANLILEELCVRYDLSEIRTLTKYGVWQTHHPEIACGLKRGFTFLHHLAGQPWPRDSELSRELLVAASPRDAIADTHWYRPDFDQFLARQAQMMGVDLWEDTRVERFEFAPDLGRSELRVERAGRRECGTAGWVIDASGPRGFLSRAGSIPEADYEGMPATQAVYSHFTGVRRWDEIFTPPPEAPFPMDDAAVHHVFEGGWIWVLRFNNGITSAGAALETSLADELRLAKGKNAWERLLERLPAVGACFESATATRPFVHHSRLAYRTRQATGPGWAMLPSACGVVDPLLSTGFTLNLLGVARWAAILERGERPELEALRAYEEDTLSELDLTARLIGALYASMADFELFGALSKLYFSAVTFTESAWRLGRRERTGRLFLLGDRKEFNHRLKSCCRMARMLQSGPADASARERLMEDILETIEPYDVAGLSRARSGPCFPARVRDLLEAAPKLGSTEKEIRAMLERTGMLCVNELESPTNGGIGSCQEPRSRA